jgi:two-component system KDP operon response regulator KdpE
MAVLYSAFPWKEGVTMSNNKYKILIVEDEAGIRNFIKTNLETSDYQVICAETYTLGMMMYPSHHPDLIILDLGLPDRDGLDLIQNVRKSDTIPIIVLSARSNEKDKVEALDLGANDYITKPFGTDELLARIRAVLRSHRQGAETASTRSGKYKFQDLLIDYDKRQVFIGRDEIDLTQTEYNIMAYLSTHTGKVMTYAAIIHAVWGYSDYGSIKKLQVNMKNIRKKMGVTPGEKRYIINELGVGYRMLEDND